MRTTPKIPRCRPRPSRWKAVPDDVIAKFVAAALWLRDRMVPRDFDDDSVVDLIIVDRRKDERLHYFPVPYRDSDPARHEELVGRNLSIAVEAFQQMLRIKALEATAERAGCSEAKPCHKPMLRWVHSARCEAEVQRARTFTALNRALYTVVSWQKHGAEVCPSRQEGNPASGLACSDCTAAVVVLERAAGVRPPTALPVPE